MAGDIFGARREVYDEDRPLMEKLGLRTQLAPTLWSDLGTVTAEEYPDATIKVEVASAPAMFWRFTITRLADTVAPRLPETIEVRTGSGMFKDYWPSVELVAAHLLTVEVVEAPTIRYKCSVCEGYDTDHRFMACPGGHWRRVGEDGTDAG